MQDCIPRSSTSSSALNQCISSLRSSQTDVVLPRCIFPGYICLCWARCLRCSHWLLSWATHQHTNPAPFPSLAQRAFIVSHLWWWICVCPCLCFWKLLGKIWKVRGTVLTRTWPRKGPQVQMVTEEKGTPCKPIRFLKLNIPTNTKFKHLPTT